MKTVEIYFSDLTQEKQKEVLETMNMESEKDGNFEMCPLAFFEIEEEETDE